MTDTSRTVIIRQIHEDEEGHFLEVSNHEDHDDHVHLHATGDDNIGYFGPLDLPMAPSFAMALGKALIAAAMEIEADYRINK